MGPVLVHLPTSIRTVVIGERPGHVSHCAQSATLMRVLDTAQCFDGMGVEQTFPARGEQTCLCLGGDEDGDCEGCESGVVDCQGDECEGGEKPGRGGEMAFG